MTYDVRADERWQYSEPKMKLFEEALKILIYCMTNISNIWQNCV